MSQMQTYTRQQELNTQELAAKKKLIMEMIPQFRKALPDFFSPERFARVCCTLLIPKDERDVRRVQALLACSPGTFFGALLACAQLGLEPDGLLGQAYLIPYNGQIKLVIGYKGLIAIAYRSGEVADISAREVRKKDEFRFNFLDGSRPSHTYDLSQDRGEIIGFYCDVTFKNGTHHFEVMSKAEVDAIRVRSASAKGSPWDTDYNAMAIKTAIKKGCKHLNLSIQRAVSYDGSAVRMDSDNEIVVEPPTFEVIENETEEAMKPSKLGARIPKAKKEEPEKTEIVNPVFDEEDKK